MQESAQGEDGNVVGTEVPFELRGFSLATVALALGGLITIGSLGEVRAWLHITCTVLPNRSISMGPQTD